MDVKIGIADSSRELTVTVDDDAAKVVEAVDSALAGNALTLIDNKGRTVIVPTDKIAYVEIGSGEMPRVGFSISG